MNNGLSRVRSASKTSFPDTNSVDSGGVVGGERGSAGQPRALAALLQESGRSDSSLGLESSVSGSYHRLEGSLSSGSNAFRPLCTSPTRTSNRSPLLQPATVNWDVGRASTQLVSAQFGVEDYRRRGGEGASSSSTSSHVLLSPRLRQGVTEVGIGSYAGDVTGGRLGCNTHGLYAAPGSAIMKTRGRGNSITSSKSGAGGGHGGSVNRSINESTTRSDRAEGLLTTAGFYRPDGSVSDAASEGRSHQPGGSGLLTGVNSARSYQTRRRSIESEHSDTGFSYSDSRLFGAYSDIGPEEDAGDLSAEAGLASGINDCVKLSPWQAHFKSLKSQLDARDGPLAESKSLRARMPCGDQAVAVDVRRGGGAQLRGLSSTGGGDHSGLRNDHQRVSSAASLPVSSPRAEVQKSWWGFGLSTGLSPQLEAQRDDEETGGEVR